MPFIPAVFRISRSDTARPVSVRFAETRWTYCGDPETHSYMEFLIWVVIALLAYSLVAPLASIVTQDVPPPPALFLATAVFLVIAAAVMLATGTADPSHAVSGNAEYVYAGGLFLSIGILAYTAALEAGPVSVVVPIYGMFIVGSSVIAILFLDETFTIERGAGIACAIAAIYLCAGDER